MTAPAHPVHPPAGAPVVLIVDDSPDVLALAAKVLGQDYHVKLAPDGGSALQMAADTPRPDLILLDVEMPGATGFEVLRVLKDDAATADIPVVFLSGKTEAQDQMEGLELGAVDYLTKPINMRLLRARVKTYIANADRERELGRLVRERTTELEEARLEVIHRLARAMEYHESAAAGNRALRVSQYARLMTQAAGGKPELCDLMSHAAPLYDIGKLAVPVEVLRKAGELTAPDWERVRRHCEIGAEIIGKHEEPVLKLAALLALTHHERWDGSGYPKKLKGEAIPWAGRVMAIVDTFEAMTTTQFYRAALPVERAAGEIERGAGKLYDPKLIEAFRHALPAMRKVRETFSDKLGDMLNLDFTARVQAVKAAAAAVQPRPKAAAKPGTHKN